jgi:pimeloyl-ACP methyl ester carboxylesterase
VYQANARTLSDRTTPDGQARSESVVGYAASVDLLARHPHATPAVFDGAGHALPHEQPELLWSLIGEWLTRANLGPRSA